MPTNTHKDGSTKTAPRHYPRARGAALTTNEQPEAEYEMLIIDAKTLKVIAVASDCVYGYRKKQKP